MPDPNLEAKPAKGAAATDAKAGFTSAVPGRGPIPAHIHPETRMARGIDPETKKRISVNLLALKAEFGEEAGMDKYTRIAKAGGFFDPSTEPSGSAFYPDLQLEGINKEAAAKVDAILSEKE